MAHICTRAVRKQLEFSTTDVGGLFSDQAQQISSILPFCDVNLYLRLVSNCTILPILVCYCPTILRFFSGEREILHLSQACFAPCHKEGEILHVKCACFALWLEEGGIFLFWRAWFAL